MTMECWKRQNQILITESKKFPKFWETVKSTTDWIVPQHAPVDTRSLWTALLIRNAKIWLSFIGRKKFCRHQKFSWSRNRLCWKRIKFFIFSVKNPTTAYLTLNNQRPLTLCRRSFHLYLSLYSVSIQALTVLGEKDGG